MLYSPRFTIASFSKHLLKAKASNHLANGTTSKLCNTNRGVLCCGDSDVHQNSVRGHSFMQMFYKLRLAQAPDPVESPRLTPQMVTSILRMNETTVKHTGGIVKEVHCNQLPANKPIEDRHLEAKLASSNKYLFGVFDGHGGCACAQTLKDRLFKYIAVALSDPNRLNQLNLGKNPAADNLLEYLGTSLKDNVSPDLASIHHQSLLQFVQEFQDIYCVDTTIDEALKNAFLRLDQDISNEVNSPTTDDGLRVDLINIAFSGSVSCVAYIDGLDLYVANVGDCRAVIGSHSTDSETWHATPITEQHDAQNAEEVKRLCEKHPNERNNILKDGRLFGELMPLRAFGDVRYKWPKNDLRSLSQVMGKNTYPFLGDYRNLNIPKHFRTPPYLDAEPEIKHYRLTPRDRFLVLSTDGLWDSEGMSVDKVISLVGHHTDGRQVLGHFHPPENAKLVEINETLRKRKSNLAKRAVDENVTTHLIRHALGLEHGQISAQLTLPEKLVRYYRDDITISVIYFDTDYIMDYTRRH